MNWYSLKWTLGRLFRPTQTDRDLDEEIRAHLAIDMRQRMDAGAGCYRRAGIRIGTDGGSAIGLQRARGDRRPAGACQGCHAHR